MAHGYYPLTRLRRLRRTSWLRRLSATVTLETGDLIWPVFVHDHADEAITSMPGLKRWSLNSLPKIADQALAHNIPALAIFPVIENSAKSANASQAINPDNLICRAIRLIKKNVPQMGIIGDVALDPYTLDGHDGLSRNSIILNDETLEILIQQALVLAEAGCDVIAPSDMMDGRVGAIRRHLDAKGFDDRAIFSYAAKYASAFYGPFRDALKTDAYLKGDKKTYQMDPTCTDAMREIALDIDEGADMIIIKPGLPYLDIIASAAKRFCIPVLGYQVSGEYAMLRTAKGLNYDEVLLESLIAFKRAGASGIITYGAMDAAGLLQS